MYRKFWLIIIFNFTIIAAFSFPQHLMEPSGRIVTSIINCDFSQSFSICDSLKNKYPTDPLPSLLKLTTMGMRDVDCEQAIDSAGFMTEFDNTETLIRNYEQNNGTSSYIVMLDGFSKAMHAAFFLRKKAYFDVLHNGIDAIKLLNQAKELDSTNNDADFFLGLYEYGKSELKKKLWMVLFWYPGSKKEGIKKLNECSKNATLTRIAAKLSLSDIYVQEKKPQLSAAIISELEKEYSTSRFVLWAKVKFLESQKQYDSAAVIYEKLSVYYALFPEGKQNFFTTRNRMAHMLRLSGKDKDAAEICRSLLSDQKLDQYRDIKRDTRKLLENLDDSKS